MKSVRLDRIDVDLLNRTAVIAAYFHVFDESGARVQEMFGESFADILVAIKPGDDPEASLNAQADWLAQQDVGPIEGVDLLRIVTLSDERHTTDVVAAYRETQIAARLPEKTPKEKTDRAAAMKTARDGLARAIEINKRDRRSAEFSDDEKSAREKQLAFEEINE